MARSVARRLLKGIGMDLDYLIAGIVAVLLCGYLVYALLYPERF